MHKLLARYLEESGSHALLRASDFVVEDVGPDFLRLTNTNREQLVGHGFFEVLPGRTGLSRELLQDGMREAAITGQPVKLATHRYDMLDQDDLWAECWWKATVVPLQEDGESFLVLRVEDETQFCQLRQAIRLQRINNYVLYSLVVALIGILVAAVTVRTEDNRKFALETCTQVQHVKKELYDTVQQQSQTLGQPGTALYKFYRRNPGILREIQAQATQNLQTFKPSRCA